MAQTDYPFQNADLPLEERVQDLVNRLTIEEKAGLLWELAPAIERLGIKKYYHGNEALHGVVRPGNFTVFPQAIAFGATFNPDLIFEVATAISSEARGRWNELDRGEKQKNWYSDLLTFWSPTVNMARDPRWGRTAETYGEDPYLSSRIGVSFVKGLQGNHQKYLKAVSTPKHFIANNTEFDRATANSIVSERTLREYYLPVYKALITEGKAEAIMASYNAVNFVPVSGNRWLLTDVLRKEWGFKGYVVGDCGAPGQMASHHNFVPSKAAAVAASLKAGLDLECSGGQYIMRDHLVEALNEGMITEDEVDFAVSNVLRARFKLGVFDPIDANPYNAISPDIVGSKAHQELALKTALEATVLLKNENNLLPLDVSKVKSIAVVGHNAQQMVYGDYSGTPLNKPVTPFEGIKKFVGSAASIQLVESKLRLSDLTIIPSRFLQTKSGEKGLEAEYFPNITLEGEGRKRIDSQVDLHSTENPPDQFLPEGLKSVRWQGYIVPPTNGEYKIGTSSDDGFRLWIDDEIIFDKWFPQGETFYETSMTFEKDKKYKVKLEWFDSGGDAACRLQWKIPGSKGVDYNEEIAAAKANDLVIAVIGTGIYNEAEGRDKKDLALPGDQLNMLKAVHAVNKNIVVVLIAGSQHSLPWIKENIPAVILPWYPGEQAGTAIADVLFGKYNPAGRLPLTYYADLEALPEVHRYEVSEGRTYLYYQGKPQWEFGFGLSYTTFEYDNLKLNSKKLKDGKDLEVSLSVKNTGRYNGDEVVQLYLAYPESKIIRPIKQLKRFKRIRIEKGEREKIKFTLSKEDLKYWSTAKQGWNVESGVVEVMVGASSADIRLSQTFHVE